MERNKTPIKSKSSSMKTQKPQADKFWSNANIQKNELRKRGLYVEKKPARFSISGFPGQDEREIPIIQRPTRRVPKFTRTEVLTSNLQSQHNATTGTQFSIQNIEVPDSPKPKKRFKLLNKMFNPDDGITETAVEKQTRRERKKSKYRSKFLNDKQNRPDKNSVVILQPRKDIDRTHSSHSQWSWGDLNQEASKFEEAIDDDNKCNFEPVSAMEELPQKPEEKELYNFFVDLLQTSYSDYKIKDVVTQSNDEESIKLEIDENVVEKLKIKPNNFIEINNQEVKRINESASYSYEDNYRRKVYQANTRVPIAKKKKNNRNVENQQKKKKETKKEKMINTIKKELEMNDTYVYEPPTMFDALKAIALRKKKVLRFQEAEPAVLSKSKKKTNKACFRGRKFEEDKSKSPYLERKSKHSSSSSNWYGDDFRFNDMFDARFNEGYDARFNEDTTFSDVNARFIEKPDANANDDLIDGSNFNSSISYSSFKMAQQRQADDKIEIQSIFNNKKNFDEEQFLPMNEDVF